MKATIQRDVSANEGEKRLSQNDPTKQYCPILVEGENKVLYAMYANEGTALWTAKVGDVIEIEPTKEPAAAGGRGFAKLMRKPGAPGAFVRRGFVKAADSETAAACDHITLLHKAITKRNPEMSTEAAATLAAAIFAKTC